MLFLLEKFALVFWIFYIAILCLNRNKIGSSIRVDILLLPVRVQMQIEVQQAFELDVSMC